MPLIVFIVQIICAYYMITYALSSKRSLLGRIGSLVMVAALWFAPYCHDGLLCQLVLDAVSRSAAEGRWAEVEAM